MKLHEPEFKRDSNGTIVDIVSPGYITFDSVKELIEASESKRKEWHRASQYYQSLPYGDCRKVAKLKCDMIKADYQSLQRLLKKLLDDMGKED